MLSSKEFVQFVYSDKTTILRCIFIYENNYNSKADLVAVEVKNDQEMKLS